ncbi:Ref family recombination enhancement nuclease [Janthinobacterium sp. TND4EL3]|uniref:Ref family recombination enhancement nuclease n=1 Tax=Janthinobacterium sp. TND4EL3 TaxID=1907311 RepID=UPI001FCD892F|nr:Ref family recombination enhancement nuclease [Janthinobacterium sp. TND4EL3]
MKPGKPLARTPFKRTSPMPSTGMLSIQSHQRTATKRKSGLKSKERAVTAAEKLMWTRLAALGCVACMKDGNFNTHVSIHHVDGRTKPGCHQLVLPLCAGHHQDGTGEDKTLIAVHPWKARFEARYGTQGELMDECAQLLFEQQDAAAAPATIQPTLEHP